MLGWQFGIMQVYHSSFVFSIIVVAALGIETEGLLSLNMFKSVSKSWAEGSGTNVRWALGFSVACKSPGKGSMNWAPEWGGILLGAGARAPWPPPLNPPL